MEVRPRAILTIFIEKAELQRDVCTIHSMSPYISIKIGKKEKKSFEARSMGKLPKWPGLKFEFEVNNDPHLRIELWHKKDLGKDKFIALCNIDLSEYLKSTVSINTKENPYKLTYKNSKAKDKEAGLLYARFQYGLINQNNQMPQFSQIPQTSMYPQQIMGSVIQNSQQQPPQQLQMMPQQMFQQFPTVQNHPVQHQQQIPQQYSQQQMQFQPPQQQIFQPPQQHQYEQITFGQYPSLPINGHPPTMFNEVQQQMYQQQSMPQQDQQQINMPTMPQQQNQPHSQNLYQQNDPLQMYSTNYYPQ